MATIHIDWTLSYDFDKVEFVAPKLLHLGDAGRDTFPHHLRICAPQGGERRLLPCTQPVQTVSRTSSSLLRNGAPTPGA